MGGPLILMLLRTSAVVFPSAHYGFRMDPSSIWLKDAGFACLAGVTEQIADSRVFNLIFIKC